jgi:predicted acylesterase/phospholipase RssA/CRP-like cAMP-binding protein
MNTGDGSTHPTQLDILNLLASLELFKDLDRFALQDFVSEFERVHFVRGETLMQSGDPADFMYVVISGRSHIVIETPDGQERVVAEIGPGESIGEMELISGEERSATVRAARDTELVRLSKSGFERLVHKHPESLMQITRTVVDRLRKTTLGCQTIGTVKTIGVLPAGTGASIEPFAERLAKVLADVGPVLRLDRRKFDRYLGEGAALDDIDIWDQTDSRIAAWLTEQETKHRFILYEADPQNSAWTRRCIRQADRILLVGIATASPEWSAPESVFFDTQLGKVTTPAELCLLHEDKRKMPTDTQRWLKQRPVVRHHHMHLHTRAHFERLVRFLTGRAIGLVLGGGGARGAAHIGVIRALDEAGIPIDMVGGTSAGGMISAQVAMGSSHDSIRGAFHRGLVESNLFKRYTLPIVSLIAAAPPDEVAKQEYKDIQIEDLWITFFCVSCNLSTGETVVHQRGPLWKAVRATTSLPGILVPVVAGKHLLVDGGVVDNLPCTIMKEKCGGPVIVVNVSPDKDVMLDEDLDEIPSPREILWSWINPFKKAIQVPTIMTLMVRVVVVNSLFRKEIAKEQADFLLDVPVDEYELMDFDAHDELIEIGYRCATDQIRVWKETNKLPDKLGIDCEIPAQGGNL